MSACTNPSNSSKNADATANDSFAIPVNQKPSALNTFSTAIQRFVEHPAMRHASVSISIMDLATGQEVAAYQPQRSVVPASSLKIIPTATGLAVLGKDYRFKTEIGYDGTLSDGVLDGNLYIKGYGDPTLGSDKLEQAVPLNALMSAWAARIRKAGIYEIKGKVVGDASWLPTAVNSPTWQWNDLGNYYASGAWGLNIHENLYYLHLQKNARLGGQPNITSTQPKMDIDWVNELTSAEKGSGDNAYIYGAPYTQRRFVRGTIPRGSGSFKIKGAIPNPPHFAAKSLQNALENNGVVVHGGATTNLEMPSPNKLAKVILTEQSPSLQVIGTECNHKSVNLYAEAILRAIAKQDSSDGHLEKGIQQCIDYWSARGWDTEGLFLEDGSGLSPRNAVSARHLSQLLYLIAKDAMLFQDFKKTLPIGGQTGTLKSLFKGTAAAGNIWAKSGSMSRVRSYTGYAQRKSGQALAFSIVANNYTCSNSEMRQQMERLMVAMCE